MRIVQLIFDSALWGSVMSFSRWGDHSKEWSAAVLKGPFGWCACSTLKSKATSERYAWIWCAKECVKHVVSSYTRNHHFFPFFHSSRTNPFIMSILTIALYFEWLSNLVLWILLEKIRMEFCFLLPYKNTRNFSIYEFLLSITPCFWSLFFFLLRFELISISIVSLCCFAITLFILRLLTSISLSFYALFLLFWQYHFSALYFVAFFVLKKLFGCDKR